MKRSVSAADGKNAYTQQKSVALSCLAGVGVAFVILAVFAFIMTVKDLPQGAITFIAIAAVVCGCLCSGYLCGKAIREGGLLYGAICGCAMFTFAFLCELILNGGGFSILLLYKFIIYISGGMMGGVLGVNQRKKVKKTTQRRKK